MVYNMVHTRGWADEEDSPMVDANNDPEVDHAVTWAASLGRAEATIIVFALTTPSGAL